MRLYLCQDFVCIEGNMACKSVKKILKDYLILHYNNKVIKQLIVRYFIFMLKNLILAESTKNVIYFLYMGFIYI